MRGFSGSNAKSVFSQWGLWERFGMWSPANDAAVNSAVPFFGGFDDMLELKIQLKTKSIKSKCSTQECLPMLKNPIVLSP